MRKNESKLYFSKMNLHTKLEKWHHYEWRHISVAALWFLDSSLNFDEEKSIVEK